MNLKQFLAEKRIGVVLRVYASKEEQIPDRVKMVEEAIERARSVVIFDHNPLRRFDVVVWADNKYKDSDCGKTKEVLRNRFVDDKDIFVEEFRHGDLFCGLLNYTIANQLEHRIHYSLILSSEAFSYLNSETVESMIQAVCQGARAVGVAINELTTSILEGRLANTFCLWHNKSLVEVGAFDLRAEKPVSDDRLAHYVRGWSSEKGEVFYHLAGVEEVIPLARLIMKYGSCVAPILPQGSGVPRYRVPDREQEPELWLRHVNKMGTKFERQVALLSEIGCDLSFLKGGVMPEYRNF